MMAMPLTTLVLAALLAQVPNPTPALDAARNARAATESAQKKNSEALDPATSAGQVPATSAGQGARQPAEKPAQPATPPAAGTPPSSSAGQGTGASVSGYSYDPAGRRDPFVTLLGRGGDVPVTGARPQGLAGLLVSEVTLKGVLKTAKGDFAALVQSPDNKTYIAHTGDKVLDGSIKAITAAEVVFTQDVNDPLSLVKQREVRKAIRPEAR